MNDIRTIALIAGVLALLTLATAVGQFLKRHPDRGVKDYGTLVVGHGGVLDRIDSMCFAAPIFYHITLLVTGA